MDDRPESSQSPELPSAGWYPDPNNGPCNRYWNGSHWTSETRPFPPPNVGVDQQSDKDSPPAPSPLPPDGKGWYPDPWKDGWERWWDGAKWDEPVRPRKPSQKEERRDLVVGILMILGATVFVAYLAVQYFGDSGRFGPESASGSAPEVFTPSLFREVEGRELARIVRDPSGHRGDRIVVFGQILQFDSATGTDMFIAQVAPDTFHIRNEAFAGSMMMEGNPEMLDQYLGGDYFRAYISVDGDQRYETAIGGRSSIAKAQISHIDLLDEDLWPMTGPDMPALAP